MKCFVIKIANYWMRLKYNTFVGAQSRSKWIISYISCPHSPFPQTPGDLKYFLSVGTSNHDQDLKFALDFPEYILTILSKFSL